MKEWSSKSLFAAGTTETVLQDPNQSPVPSPLHSVALPPPLYVGGLSALAGGSASECEFPLKRNLPVLPQNVYGTFVTASASGTCFIPVLSFNRIGLVVKDFFRE